MEVKLLYRRMDVNGKKYYQLFRIVDEKENLENVREYNGERNAKLFYIKSAYDPSLFDVVNDVFSLNSNGKMERIDNFCEFCNVKKAFWMRYGDFSLTPKNEIDIPKLRAILKKEVLFRDKEIEQILNIIKSNQDVLDSDIDDDSKSEMVHNILLYGPSGYGKSQIVKTLAEKMPMNSIVLRLSHDPADNLQNLARGLIASSNGNVFAAERGIVFIEDNFDELDQTIGGNSLTLLEQLMNNRIINITIGDESYELDLSNVTFVVEKVTEDDEIECLADEGFSEGLYNSFKKIINISQLTEEQVKEIVLKHKKSVINVYKKVLASIGKKLVIEDGFIDKLIEDVFEDNGGLKTINRCLEVLIKSKWHLNTIVLSKSMLQNSTLVTDCVFKNAINDEPDDSKEQVEDTKNNGSSISESSVCNQREDYKKILEQLQMYVKGQDQPLMEILYQMFINNVFQTSNLSVEDKKRRIKHLLIRGGTGTGKTYISSLVAGSFANKPHIIVDCKQYTETGFVGKSVEDMLIQLYNASGKDLDKAQKGIIILDEFDKLASGGDGRSESVNRGGVQESFLKLLEGNSFEIELDRMGGKRISFDTRNVVFICLGAFENLDKIREQRLKKSKGVTRIGFGDTSKKEEKTVNEDYTLEDMQEFGIQPQLLRRITFQKDLNKLDRESYRSIMLESKSSAFLLKIEQMGLIGTTVSYDDEFIESFLDRVVTMGYGASSIDILISNIFKGIEIKAFMEDYEKIILNKECVTDPSKIVTVPRKHITKRKA